jgi:hypothetical protein
MHRPDAATRSITRVIVRSDRVELCYEPVRWARGKPQVLAPAATSLLRRHPARAALCSYRAFCPTCCA